MNPRASAKAGTRLLLLGVWALGGLARADQSPEQREPLRVRLGSLSRHELQVLGLEEGLLRLRPSDSERGEIALRLEEASDLQFLLPASYQEAQQLAYQHRPAEALEQLRPVIESLLPYLAAPGTNAVSAVQTYLDLLLQQREWLTAWALVERLPGGLLSGPLGERLLPLADGLRRAGEAGSAAALLTRLPLEERTDLVPAVETFAHGLRRLRHFAPAQVLYERLQPVDPPEARTDRALLIAYVLWHQGATSEVSTCLAVLEEPPAETGASTLYLLLQGLLALERGDSSAALDGLARALVTATGGAEWRVELQAVLAQAYAQAGRGALAAVLENDLRRLHPLSPWAPPAPSGPESEAPRPDA